MRVVVTGGTGFLGKALVARLASAGHETVVLTRDPGRAAPLPAGARAEAWGGGATAWERLVDGAGALVNLAGEPVAQRWTAEAKERIVASRLEAAARLRAAVERATVRPAVLVNASAVGFYGDRGDEELTEESPAGKGFLAETTRRWEEAAESLAPLVPRIVRLRIGVVLGEGGGALPKMLLPFRFGAGGPLGSGRQWVPWVHLDDVSGLALLAVDDPRIRGPLNAVAPNPVRMAELARTLGRVLHRPAFAPAPAFVLKAVLGEMATAVLDSARVVPAKAQALGYGFRHPDLEEALRRILGRPG